MGRGVDGGDKGSSSLLDLFEYGIYHLSTVLGDGGRGSSPSWIVYGVAVAVGEKGEEEIQ